jgi:hypothetical protein
MDKQTEFQPMCSTLIALVVQLYSWNWRLESGALQRDVEGSRGLHWNILDKKFSYEAILIK